MLERVAADSGIAEAVLESEFRNVFRRHGTSEYAFAIEELPSLQAKYPNQKLNETFAEAIHVYNSARKANLCLYPSVFSTLENVKDKGCLIIGYTESMAYYSNTRMKRLGLDRILDYLYSPEDHELPVGISKDQLRRYSPEHYALRRTIPRHTPTGERKPNPAVLKDIVYSVGGALDESIYIGDNLLKDITMAQAMPLTDVWAK
jgi:phosphoglycolate phosphatase